MAGKGTLTVRVLGDTRDVESKLGKVSGGFAKFGAAAAGATVVAGAAAVGLAREVLNTGAKLESWRKKTDTVFERSAGAIRKWADRNNEVFGVTDDELAGLAASFGDLLKPMGFTAEQAAKMSQDVIGLSGALSEWTGGQKSAAEVSDILSKAMLGERDGLKALGISITEAEVKAKLLEKGQQDLTGAALQQAQALATQELIFAKSTDAQTAFAEGGNKALRAQNGLKAGLGELREQIADRLLPIVTKIAQWMADHLPAALDKAGKIAGDLQAKWDQVFPHIQRVVETFGEVVRTVVDTVTGLFKRSEGDIDGSASKVRGILERLQSTFKAIFDAVQAIISTFVTVITALWERFGDDILSFAKETFDNVLQTIDGVLQAVQGVFDIFAGIFTGDWSRVWDGVKAVFGGVWDAILATLKTILGAVELTVTATLDLLVGWFKGLPQRFVDALVGGIGLLRDIGDRMVRWIWQGIRALVNGGGGLLEWFVGLPGKIVGKVSEAFGELVQLGKDIVGEIVKGVVAVAGDIIDAIVGGVTGGFGRVLGALGVGDGPGRQRASGGRRFDDAGPSRGGKTLDRVNSILGSFPGARVTSTYRSPEHNRRVGGSPTSFHLDKSNPAVDIAGPTRVLDAIHARLKAMGGWRELLWRVPNHAPGDNPHVHVAHQGGVVSRSWPTLPGLRSDERPAVLQVGETITPRGGATVNVTINAPSTNPHDIARTAALALRMAV